MAGHVQVVTPEYKDPNEQDKSKLPQLEDFMTPDEVALGRFLQNRYISAAADLSETAQFFFWDEIDEAYSVYREPSTNDPDYPCSFVPILTPSIEGQAAHIANMDMRTVVVARDPAHEHLMGTYDSALEFSKQVGNFKAMTKDAARSYARMGNCILKVELAKTYGSARVPKLYGRTVLVPIRDVLFDGRIKDNKQMQDSEYIIHVHRNVAISWIRAEYGDEKANACMSLNALANAPLAKESVDDYHSVNLLEVWIRDYKTDKLRVVMMDEQGLIFSAKPSPYRTAGNLFPFYFCRAIPVEGRLHGFGDGLMLLPMQEVTNQLTDDIELAARTGAHPKVLYDPRSKITAKTITSDPRKWQMCINPNQYVRTVEGRGINPITFNMISMLKQMSEDATGFRPVMTGDTGAASTTATGVMQGVTQGSVVMTSKKNDLIAGLEFCLRFSLKIAQQYWNRSFWFVPEDMPPVMVDMPSAKRAGAGIPLSPARADEIRAGLKKANKKATPENFPEFEQDSQTMVDVDMDVRLEIGSQIGKGPNDRFNQTIAAAQLNQRKQDGQIEYVMSIDQARNILEKVTGLPMLTPAEKRAKKKAIMAELVAQTTGLAGGGQVNPLTPGAGPQAPNGANIQTVPDAVNSAIPGASSTDKRGMSLV